MEGDLRTAWKAYRAHWLRFAAATLALFGSWVLLELAVVATARFGLVPWLALHLAFLVAFCGLVVGLNRMALDTVDGETPQLRLLLVSLRQGPALLVATAASALATLAGLLAFVLPGIYVGVRYSLLPVVVAARPGSGSVREAFNEAWTVTRGRWWQVFRLQLVLLALNVCGAALLGIGLLVSFPVSVLAATGLYRSLRWDCAPTAVHKRT